jgi:hypothetical protein
VVLILWYGMVVGLASCFMLHDGSWWSEKGCGRSSAGACGGCTESLVSTGTGRCVVTFGERGLLGAYFQFQPGIPGRFVEEGVNKE